MLRFFGIAPSPTEETTTRRQLVASIVLVTIFLLGVWSLTNGREVVWAMISRRFITTQTQSEAKSADLAPQAKAPEIPPVAQTKPADPPKPDPVNSELYKMYSKPVITGVTVSGKAFVAQAGGYVVGVVALNVPKGSQIFLPIDASYDPDGGTMTRNLDGKSQPAIILFSPGAVTGVAIIGVEITEKLGSGMKAGALIGRALDKKIEGWGTDCNVVIVIGSKDHNSDELQAVADKILKSR